LPSEPNALREPPARNSATATAVSRCSALSPRRRAAATAAPIGPHTAVGCQPRSYRDGWLAEATAAIAS
jgi:hypothetical protein